MSVNSIEKGLILRIYLENFVTYDKVVIKPGRNLNVIIGPNGSGKSTIVCAIVLGLAGKPTIIGRAQHVADYVKAGRKEAKIEIELKESRKKSVTITRIFNIDDKTTWMINGNVVTLKSIKELIAGFNIQIDNLCQFLPQDKVQDFAKMNSRELLENTEKSVGDPILSEYHDKLKNSRVYQKNLETEVAHKQRLLESQKQKYESLHEVVSTLKERKRIKKKIVTLKQKRAWLLYDEKFEQLSTLKKTKDAVMAELKAMENELKPIQNAVNKIRSEMKSLQNSIDNHNKDLLTKINDDKRILNKILTCENDIKDCETQCSSRLRAEENRDQEIKSEQQQKHKLENDLSYRLQEVGGEEALLQQQQDTMSHIAKERNVITNLDQQRTMIKEQDASCRQKIRALEEQHETVNIQTKRLELLRQWSRDAYQGVLWLRDNRNKFTAQVYEPMLLNINVKHVSYAKYIENTVPMRDLQAFVCENKSDMNILLQYLRDQQKLRVNVVHSDPMKKVYMDSIIPLHTIRQYGFTHYLVSLIEAPSTVMKYLVSMYRLNNIPIGSSEVDNNVDRIPHTLSYYFSEDSSYSVSMSKYTGAKSTKISHISGSGALSIVLDESKLLQIKQRLEALNMERDNVSTSLKQIEESIRQKTEELERYRNTAKKYQLDIKQIEALRTRIAMCDKTIEDLQKERTTPEEIKASCAAKIQTIIRNQLSTYKQLKSHLDKYSKSVILNNQMKLLVECKQRSLFVKENEYQEFKVKCDLAQKKYKAVDEQFLPLRNEAEKLYAEAVETTNGLNPQCAEFKSFNIAFAKLPYTIDEIDKDLHVARAKVYCMGNNIDGENVFREYETVGTNIQDMETTLQEKMKQLETINEDTEQLRDKWLTPLKSLIERINTNFREYFSVINCAGEVVLSHGENIMDFDQYGLKIRVKFRDSDELQELTKNHQSGGERAVTTAIYMIALQELSKVPFRCVDEINQGMDTTNERRVFEMLVKMTGKPGSSQYFLLTPKLLPNLQYSETVTVHCVFNGPFLIGHTEFDTEGYCNHVVKVLEKIDE